MRRFLATIKISFLGWLLIAVVPVCLLLAFLGPHAVQAPAFVIGVLVLGAVVTEALGMPRFGSFRAPASGRERAERIQSARPGPESMEVEVDEDAWRRERERRERTGGGL